MKVFSRLSTREVLVSSLKLDPSNPRLRLHPGGTTERDIIERLCRLGSQSPSRVVKHILADHGYLDNELPIVYKAPGNSPLIVIDGNRRIAALKMINNPSLIPSTLRGLKSDCETLKGLVPNKIRYWVTTSLADAKRIVYRAHNEGTKEWETLARYATHYDSHRAGQTISEIAELTGSQQKDIRDRINVWLLYEAMMNHIPQFEIDDDGITNFERITTSYQAFPRRLGISLSPEGIYEIPASPDLVKVIHKAFLASAKAERFTRNVANNDEAREKFWDEILPIDFSPPEQPEGSPSQSGVESSWSDDRRSSAV